jgi:hypothetical protein
MSIYRVRPPHTRCVLDGLVLEMKWDMQHGYLRGNRRIGEAVRYLQKMRKRVLRKESKS